MNTDPNLLRVLFDAAPEGVMVCDARTEDWPVVYVNRAMAQLTGYPVTEFYGRNPRFLYANDRDQEGLKHLRAAMSEGAGCHVVVRNIRPDGTVFFNDITLVPLHDDSGALTHYASFHREGVGSLKETLAAAVAGQRAAGQVHGKSAQAAGDPSASDQSKDLLSTQSMLAYVRDDKLTGLLRRSYFEDLLQRDWGLAQRESRRLTLVVFDLDFFDQYRDVFGKQGADQCFRRIARVLAGCFRRSTDLCARMDEDQVVALTVGMEDADAARFVESILGRIRDLAIHHPRSSISRYITVSAGVASMAPGPDSSKDQLIGAALGALRRAKDLGRNRVVCAA
jgi:diguanylate cyclase (GGDEF)-like protein/PAS domain S-box-containing protein